ncbi:hypothetical protein CHH28_15525 [Bacterioplanes sanyensis]|uniref:Uncharacterized protein n=1 Tax=Bacterioplanes sanyensis TaxID=1249553 RepID=A0A222FLU8_9GAMM|nr:hypothetical protein [Bacterioplanes sanyensis]ASP39997.1 hypothetical protein CHH28_15525 [Bacterioplanes sanyensis]
MISRAAPVVWLLAALLAGCSGNSTSSSGGNAKPLNSANGYAGASNISSAQLFAVPLNSQGQPLQEQDDAGNPILAGFKASTAPTAYFEVSTDGDNSGQPYVMILRSDDNTKQRCELVSGCAGTAYLGELGFSEEEPLELRAGVGRIANGMRINVNWLTHLASAVAYTHYIDDQTPGLDQPNTPTAGVYSPYRIEYGNLWVSRLFDLPDVIATRPLAPSQLFQSTDMNSAALTQSIAHGAVVAAAQQLAMEQQLSVPQWLNQVIDQLLQDGGQLPQKDEDPTRLSRFDIYQAAHQLLADNIDYLRSVQAQLPTEVDSALTLLAQHRDAQQSDAMTQVAVSSEDVGLWLDQLANAKLFIKDLNQRLVNFAGDDANTCGREGAAADCLPSFVDPQYADRVAAYYDRIEEVYDGLSPTFASTREQLLSLSQDYIACLNGQCPALPAGTSYDGAAQALRVQSEGHDLTLTFAPVLLDVAGEGDDSYFAFDIFIDGTLQAAGQTLRFNPVTVTNSAGEQEQRLNRLRLVFDEDEDGRALPAYPSLDGDYCEQMPCRDALGYTFDWPEVRLGYEEQSLRLVFDASLIGVKDPLKPELRYHYNVTTASLGLLVQGPVKGTVVEQGEEVELRDQMELTLTGKASGAPDYYSDSVWPELDDFFVARPEADVPTIEPNLFRIRVGDDTAEIDGQQRPLQYMTVYTQGIGTNRFELFSVDGQQNLRKCLVGDNDEILSCPDRTEVDGDVSFQSIVDDGQLSSFVMPSRGIYQIQYDQAQHGALVSGFDQPLDGKLVAANAQGIDSLAALLAHELVDGAGDNVSRAPLGIVRLNLTRKQADVWEAAVSAGYDYDYLVDILPTGERAQSLYLSYLTRLSSATRDDQDITVATELGALVVFRGGVTLLGNADGESIGVSIASRVEYERDDNADEATGACGLINRSELLAKDCDAVAYISYRNVLLGVIREEQNGVYVARFADGEFLVLGG